MKIADIIHKSKCFFILAIFSSLATGKVNADNFREEYAKLDSLSNINNLVYNGAVYPAWIDENTFGYETRDKEGLKYYKVDIVSKSKDLWSKDSLKTMSPQEKKACENKNISPDAKWEAFIRDSNMWLREISTNKEHQLSFDGTTNDFYITINWSPDSRKVASIKKQDSPMHRIPLLESSPKNQLQPILQWRDYYKPGDLLPVYRPALFDVESLSKIKINTRPYDDQYYLEFGKWFSDSNGFTFEYNQRGHQVFQVVKVDAETGQTKVLVDERSKTFIYYYRNYIYYTKNDKHIIWLSERDNWRHLYLIDTNTGKIVRQLTKGDWVVRYVLQVNEEENYILLAGSGKNRGEDPYNIHYYRVNMTDGSMIDLTPENANHRAAFNSNMEYFVDTYSRPDLPPVSVVRSIKNADVLMELQQADIAPLLKIGWTMPEVFHTKGRDGETDIWGNIYRPSNFNPRKKYPVVEYIYAGPQDSYVAKDFGAYKFFYKLLKLGFIVVTVDGMGTFNRSKSFHEIIWRNLKDSGFEDRMIWIKEAAKKHKHMDISNMGIFGYSAGGQSTMWALLHHNDFYKVGVSLCGCHDNRMDKIWWNEQWMGYPIGPWYSESSNVDYAYKLEGKLLLINGELDDNVDPASTLQVVNALVKANKDFEQLYLPGYGHSLGDEYVTRKVFEFLNKNCKRKP